MIIHFSCFDWSFNPCSVGLLIQRLGNEIFPKSGMCFNPCSVGLLIQRDYNLFNQIRDRGFNPCSVGLLIQSHSSNAGHHNICLFQSLFCWTINSKSDLYLNMLLENTFQSLFCWTINSKLPKLNPRLIHRHSFNPCSVGLLIQSPAPVV